MSKTPENKTTPVADATDNPAVETEKTERVQDGVAVTDEKAVVPLAQLTSKAKGAAPSLPEATSDSSTESEEEKKKKRPSQTFEEWRAEIEANNEGQSFAEVLGVKKKHPRFDEISSEIEELNKDRDIGKEGSVIVARVSYSFDEQGNIVIHDAKGDLEKLSFKGPDGKQYGFTEKGELTVDGKVREQSKAQTQTATVTQDAPAVESPARETPAKEPKETEAPALQTSSREADGVTTQKKRIPPQSVPSAEPESAEKDSKAKESQTFEQWKEGIEKEGKSFAEHIGVDKENPNFDKIANDIEKLNAGRDVGKDGIVVAKATYEFDKDGKPVIKEAQGDLSRISIEGKDGKTYGFDEKGALVEKPKEQTTAVTKDAKEAPAKAEPATERAAPAQEQATPAQTEPTAERASAQAEASEAPDTKAPATAKKDEPAPAQSHSNEMDSIIASLQKGGASAAQSTTPNNSTSAPLAPHNAQEADKSQSR